MSASTERLVEQIKLIEQAIAAAEAAGTDALPLKADLRHYQRKLSASNEALNEGKQVLKD